MVLVSGIELAGALVDERPKYAVCISNESEISIVEAATVITNV